MNQGGAGMGGGMGGGMNPMGMNPMMMGMNPMMMGMGADGMGMPGMGMGMMPGMGMGMGGMGPPGGMGMGPPSGGPMGGGPMGVDMNDGKFYKTKICHKFMEGKCNYGPTCKYAHGEADLRPGGGGGPSQPRPPQGSGKIMTPHGPPMGAGPGMGGPGMGGGMGGGMAGGMGGGMGMGAKPQVNPGEKGAHFRTRLCEQFMKEGQCRYGTTCTFAHGQQELRPFGSAGGAQKPGPRPNMNAAPQAGAQKRPLDGQGAADAQKRARTEAVAPPEQEVLPSEGNSMEMSALKQRFQALVQEANRFARDTGHSVAVFTVGGLITDAEDETTPEADHNLVAVKGVPNMKVAVLKHGTGGVSKTLATRAEIVKFVSARGSKALSELYQQSKASEDASA